MHSALLHTSSSIDVSQSIYWTKIRQQINDRCGLYFKDHELSSLEALIRSRMEIIEIQAISDYYEYISQDANEFRELMNLLTIRHTYFFRNENQFRALREVVLPQLIESRKCSSRPQLRIWSAGCSTGQEPYSIAIVLLDMIPDLKQWEIEILATDVSTEALKAARQGIYKASSMKLVDPLLIKRHFKRLEKGETDIYQVREHVRDMVNIHYLNLLDEHFPFGMDIIFCRNVMIYFDNQTVRDLIDRFHTCLSTDGFLFIGYSESLSTKQFAFCDYKDGLYYQKVSPSDSHVHTKRHPEVDTREILCTSTTVPDMHTGSVDTSSESGNPDIADIEHAISDKAYDEALGMIDHVCQHGSDVIMPAYYAAHIHIHKGQYGEAREWLDRVKAADEFFAPTYYLLGTIHMEEDELDQAVDCLRKAIYLDANLVMAHFALAGVYRRQDNISQALRHYRNTIKVLSAGPPEQEVPYSGGFVQASMISICQNNIERIQEEQ